MTKKHYGLNQLAAMRQHAQRVTMGPAINRLMHAPRVQNIAGLGNAAFPGMATPAQPYPNGMVYQDQVASLGAEQAIAPAEDPRFAHYNAIPAWYVVNITLGGDDNDTMTGNVTLRPELFVLKRITWATTGDTYPAVDQEPGYSLQGRAVTLTWGDEFTKLFGNTSALVAAAFGDANGFLDVFKGALFQGSQTLSVSLTRLHWPANTTPIDTRWDIVFSGLALLPPGVNQSGSAG